MLVRHLRETTAPAESIRFTLSAPDNAQFGGLVGAGSGQAAQVSVSPDGRFVVFVAGIQNTYTLWIRPVDVATSQSLNGTENAAFPFWSPDSRFIGFFADGKLKKIPISGGPPLILCDAPTGRGGTWNADDVVVFDPAPTGPLMRVSGAGGIPTAASALDRTYGETNHRFPHFLPDGRHFFYTAVTGPAGSAPRPSLIKIGSLDAPESVTLFAAESSAAYASGHLLFVRETTLMAQPFDVASRRTQGNPFPVADQIGTEGSRYATFAVSPAGVLVYGRGNVARGLQLTWFDRSGKILSTVGTVNAYSNISLSPDERQAAVTLSTGTPPNNDVWIVDLARAVSRRLTFDPGDDSHPVWSPDGSRIAYQSLRSAEPGIRTAPAIGGAGEELLLKFVRPVTVGYPTDWSHDGRFIAYMQGASGDSNAWVLPVSGDRKPLPVAATPFIEDAPTFSPDGRWIAYTSNESGQFQVYVERFPVSAGKYQVSQNGGGQPRWRGDGRELFFIARDSMMMAAAIDTSRSFEAGVPLALFPSRSAGTVQARSQYAVTKDGKRFLIPALPQTATSAPLTVVVNWLAAVQK